MKANKKFRTTDEYIATFPDKVETTLQEIRQVIREAAPDAKEVISYQMPAFEQNGILVWFAAFKDHIGFFPKTSAIEKFGKELSSYELSKGTIRFPLDKPIPSDLIRKIVRYRVTENLEKKPNAKRGLVAKASTAINARIEKVWDGLTTPSIIKQYMFGTEVVSDWKEGSPIFWRGEWQGKKYEDKGVILKKQRKRLIQYSHFSPLSGERDTPENYHIVTIKLEAKGPKTTVSLSQDNNATEEDRRHSEENWKMMLGALKKLLEK